MRILSPSELIEKAKKYFDRKDLIIVITVAVMMILGNFIFLTNEGAAHDALNNTYTYFAGSWEISLGRFLVGFMDHVRFGIVDKVVITSLCTIFLIGTLILIRRLFKIENKIHIFFVSFLFCVTPFITEILAYTFCADSYFLALFLATLSVVLLNKKTTKSRVLAVLAIVTFTAIYQSMLGVMLGLVVILAIKNALKNDDLKNEIKTLVVNGIIILVSLVIYYGLVKVVCAISGVELSGYQGANSVGIETIFSIPRGIKKAISDFVRFYANADSWIANTYYSRTIVYKILAVVSGISIIILIKNIKKNRLGRGIFIVVLLMILPVAINITDVISPSTRYYMLTAVGQMSMITLFFVIWQNLPKTNISNLLKWASTLCIIFIAWTFVLSNNYNQTLKKHTYEVFDHFATDVVNRAESLEEYKDDMKWMFNHEIGTKSIDWNKANGSISTVGVSHDSFSGVSRYYKYFEKYLGFEMEMVDKETYDEIIESDEFKEMTVYPAKNSVKIINDVVVVKTAEGSY